MNREVVMDILTNVKIAMQSRARDFSYDAKDFYGSFRGRTFIYGGLVIMGAVLLMSLLFSGTNSLRSSESAERSQYFRASQTEDAETFTYFEETSVGQFLAYGTVKTTEADCVAFEEMSSCVTAVSRDKEEYTAVVETYQCGTEKNPQTCTRIVYKWLWAGSDTLSTEKVTFLEREMNYSLVNIGYRNVNADDIVSGSTGDLFGYYYYKDSDTRYSYSIVPLEYSGTAFLNTNAGELTKVKGFSEGMTIEEVLESKKHSSGLPTFLEWFVGIIIVGGALASIYFIFRNDYDDGSDDTF